MRISAQIFPRPVALVTTISDDGSPNVATFSFIMPVSFEPKFVALAVGENRLTLRNLETIREFGLNVLKREQIRLAQICGSHSGKDVDKFKLAGLSVERAKEIKPPLIKEAPISLECKVEYIQKFGDHYLVVGKVVREVVREEKFDPLLHYAGDSFFTWKPLTSL